MMILASKDEALARIGAGKTMVASPGCGAPSTLLQAIADDPDEVAGGTLLSGLLLGDYVFLDAVRAGTLRYGTWHVMPQIREMVADGTVPFFPVRASQVPAMLTDFGVNTALVRLSPPDRHGFCSLGPSVSYPLLAIRAADLVVAEIDESVPRTHGESAVHVSEIDVAIASELPMPEYPRAKADEVSRTIARNIIPLLPANPTIQIGIGSIPEALLDELQAHEIRNLRFAGMGIDGMADLHEAGLLAHDSFVPFPPLMCAELMGTQRLMSFAADNPILGMYSTPFSINAHRLAEIPNFASINSAIEIDLRGQINAEWTRDQQLSGVGGSIDFVEAAIHSDGGVRIIAMRSATARNVANKIVGALATETPVTVPRHSVDYVVTENGVARLAFASVRERAQLLASVAASESPDAVGDGALVL
jgi:4-hydroxybutyrate CoA-transferase